MNWEIVRNNWKHFKGTIRARWGKLSDIHLDVIAGNREHLLGKLQETYGLDRVDADSEVKVFEVRYQAYGVKQ